MSAIGKLPLSSKKIVITSVPRPRKATRTFIKDLLVFLPYSSYYLREADHSLEDLMTSAEANAATDLLVVSEAKNRPRNLLHASFTNRTCAVFTVVTFEPINSIRRRAAHRSTVPEVVVENFGSGLGKKTAAALRGLFPTEENLAARTLVVFRNENDFVFVRKYRYLFESVSDVKLQEMGPRLTLRLCTLRSLDAEEFEFNEFALQKAERKALFRTFNLS